LCCPAEKERQTRFSISISKMAERIEKHWGLDTFRTELEGPHKKNTKRQTEAENNKNKKNNLAEELGRELFHSGHMLGA